MASENSFRQTSIAQRPLIDVVLLHGIIGDYRGTWSSGSGAFWPNWLAEDLGNLNIYAAGYPASIFSQWLNREMDLFERAGNLLEHMAGLGLGQRPIAFITHSLGGILLKLLLHRASSSMDQDLRRIADSANFVAFFSTPHSGADIARALSLIPGTSPHIKLLANDAGMLEDINLRYRAYVGQRKDIQTVAYYEKHRTNGVLIVSRESADPGLTSTHPTALDKDHINICKPADRDDVAYLSIKRHIENLRKSVVSDRSVDHSSTEYSGRTEHTYLEKQSRAGGRRELENQSCIATFKRKLLGHRDKVNSVAFNPNGKWLASGSSDNTIIVWDVETGERVASLTGHTGPISSVAFVQEGARILSCSWDNSIRVWDIQSEKLVCALKGSNVGVTGAILLNGGSHVLSCLSNGYVDLWDIESKERLKTTKIHKAFVTAVVACGDGMALSSSFDTTVKLWNITSGECLLTLEGHSQAVRSVHVSGDGRYAISGSDDKTVKLWNLEEGTCIRTIEAAQKKTVFSVAISPDGAYIATAGFNDHTTKIWDARLERSLQTISHKENPSPISLAFSQKDRLLAVGASRTNSVYIYSIN